MKQEINRYLQLTKPKVTLLNLFVGVTCFVLAAFPTISWFKLALFALIGYLAAGGCGVLNSFYDRDIDKLMLRTSKRAIPAGQVASNEALVLGVAMIAASFGFSYFLFNPMTCLMLGLAALGTWL
jgi:protoheme IX farnesyltransferase